jgi:iron complex outermembrane receptor protein
MVKGFSVFADYSEGMKGNPYVLYVGPPKPEFSRQVEAGIKFDLGHGVSGTAAAFQIDRTDAPVFTGIADEAIGKQRSRGADLDVIWQPTTSWRFIANYEHVDARQVNAIPGVAAAGNVLNIVPPDSGRFWTVYRFDGALTGWSAGAGVYAASGAYVDPANQYKTTGFATVDGKIAYEGEKFIASIDVKNLLGARYFVPYNYYGGRIAPGEGRLIYGQVAVKF